MKELNRGKYRNGGHVILKKSNRKEIHFRSLVLFSKLVPYCLVENTVLYVILPVQCSPEPEYPFRHAQW